MGYKLSKRAQAQILDILDFSFTQFGELQAREYYQSFQKSFELLVHHPHLGRSIGHIRKGYFRFEHESHIIFYKIKQDEIMIMRVLHQKMDLKRHI